MIGSPPAGFDSAFFAWLEAASEELHGSFVSEGGWDEEAISQMEQSYGIELPEDIRRFYSRHAVWGVLPDWTGWDRVLVAVRQSGDVGVPLFPVDLSSYGSDGRDVVAAVESPTCDQIVTRDRCTGASRRFENLRAYFVQEVNDEIARCSELPSGQP